MAASASCELCSCSLSLWLGQLLLPRRGGTTRRDAHELCCYRGREERRRANFLRAKICRQGGEGRQKVERLSMQKGAKPLSSSTCPRLAAKASAYADCRELVSSSVLPLRGYVFIMSFHKEGNLDKNQECRVHAAHRGNHLCDRNPFSSALVCILPRLQCG